MNEQYKSCPVPLLVIEYNVVQWPQKSSRKELRAENLQVKVILKLLE